MCFEKETKMNFRKRNELSKIQILKNIGAFLLKVVVVVAIGYSVVAFGGQTTEMVGESMAPQENIKGCTTRSFTEKYRRRTTCYEKHNG